MDRIKQALDRARSEREAATNDQAADNGSKNAKKSGHAGSSTPQITYSQTKIANLDKQLLRANRVIYGSEDRSGLAAYKMLRTQVLQRMTAHGWNALAVTSPGQNEGKSLTAINLAISLARELHHTVLLVDMDLRKPSIHKYFGITPEKGIGDYLLRDASLSDILVNPGIERLVLLPGTDSIENSSEILASPAMGSLVQELKARYPSRMVLFDLPPVLPADDALSFVPFVDAFLLVLKEGQVTRTELKHTMEIMKEAMIIGTVLNGSNERVSTYY